MTSYENELAQIVAELNRAASGSRDPRKDVGQGSATLDQLLMHAAQRGASDVLLIAGSPVTLRLNGALAPAAGPALGAEDTGNLLLPLLTSTQYQELQRHKSVDLCFTREGIGADVDGLGLIVGLLATSHRARAAIGSVGVHFLLGEQGTIDVVRKA